jgi:ABC-type transporter MlaC component
MNTLLSFLGNWQVKLLLIFVLVFSAGVWHKAQVKTAVNEAVTQVVSDIEIQSARERFKLLDKANEESIRLRLQLEKNKQEKDYEIQIANTKYSNLLEWVRNLPSETSSGSSTLSPGDSEARTEEVIAELRRRHANSFARYSFDAEEVKVHLVQCYKDYDAAKVSIDKFLKENASKSP